GETGVVDVHPRDARWEAMRGPGEVGVDVAHRGEAIEEARGRQLDADGAELLLRNGRQQLARGDVLALLDGLALEQQDVVTSLGEADRGGTARRTGADHDDLCVRARRAAPHPAAAISSAKSSGTRNDCGGGGPQAYT